MKEFTFLQKAILLVAMMGWTMMGSAQRYEKDHGRVYFSYGIMEQVDMQSFVDLGGGYAKDRNNVYKDGRVLEYVDPSTFRLTDRSTWRHRERNEEPEAAPRGYFKTNMNVYYGDRKLDAMAANFVELGGGYAKDAFNVYYCGEKVKGAMAATFKYTGDGYGEDSFNAYYKGKKIE